MLYKFSWQERAGSFPNRIPSSISLFRFHSRTVWWMGCFREEKGATLPHRAYSEQYFYCSPSNKSSRKYFICQNALSRSWITKHVQLKGVKITPRNRWGSCSWGTSYLLQFVDSILYLSFWGAVICLLEGKKKIPHMHARHVSSMVSQTFVHCGPSRRKKQKHFPPGGASTHGRPRWGLCLAPPSLPCSLRDKPTLSRQPEFHSLARPQAPVSGLLWYLWGAYQFYGGFANEVWTDSSRVQATKVSRRGCGILFN